MKKEQEIENRDLPSLELTSRLADWPGSIETGFLENLFLLLSILFVLKHPRFKGELQA